MPLPRRLGHAVGKAFREVDRRVTSGLVYPKITVEGGRTASGVEIFGQADLPDGTVLRYEVAAPGPLFGLIGGHRQMGEIRVSGGRYSVALEPSPWKGPVVEAAISVTADPSQPAPTQALLGRHGKRLAGDVSGHGHSSFFVTARLHL